MKRSIRHINKRHDVVSYSIGSYNFIKRRISKRSNKGSNTWKEMMIWDKNITTIYRLIRFKTQ